MGRVNKVVVVDEADWKAFQMLNPGQASEFVRNWIRSYLGKARGDASQIDIELTRRELEKKTEQLNKIQSEVSSLQNDLDSARKHFEDHQKKELEAEKAKLEAEALKKKCMNCHREIEKPIDVKGVKYQLCVMCLSTVRMDPRLSDYEVKE